MRPRRCDAPKARFQHDVVKNAAIEIALNELLGTPTPDDWGDPSAQLRRKRALEQAACNAGEAMVELLVRLNAERAQNIHMHEGKCVLTAVDTQFTLHRALTDYRRRTLEANGEMVAREAITRAYGGGISLLTWNALVGLRELITNEMQMLHVAPRVSATHQPASSPLSSAGLSGSVPKSQ
jgi:hypothetical protein